MSKGMRGAAHFSAEKRFNNKRITLSAENRTKVNMHNLFCTAIFFVAVMRAGAEELDCCVSQTSDRTYTYSVTATNGTGCQYSWTNGTTVLANEAEKPQDPVVNKNRTSLTTKKCLETVQYKLDCTSDDTQQKASCAVVCSGNPGPHYGHAGSVSAVIAVVSLVLLVIIISIVTICLRK